MLFRQLLGLALLGSPVLAGCQQQNPPAQTASSAQPVEAPAPQQNIITGQLAETFDAGGYTYVKVQSADSTVWAAGPISPVKTGDQISFSSRMPMRNFHSTALNRDFDIIYFVSGFTVNGQNLSQQQADPHEGLNGKAAAKPLKSFSPLKDGQTIAEILNRQNELAGQSVKIRAQVSKFTGDVMGKNWLHIRDHSSQQDLTITSQGSAALGDIITLEGTLVRDKDFGYGYVYDLIIEDAKIQPTP